jgi:hypothetical protein
VLTQALALYRTAYPLKGMLEQIMVTCVLKDSSIASTRQTEICTALATVDKRIADGADEEMQLLALSMALWRLFRSSMR